MTQCFSQCHNAIGDNGPVTDAERERGGANAVGMQMEPLQAPTHSVSVMHANVNI